jgi:threonine synthase
MSTVPDSNVHCLSLSGTFDDCQDIVKNLFSDPSFNKKHNLGAVNSINWARILAQTVYYFQTYLRAKKDGLLDDGKKLQFVVPTGNFGDILAGYYAKRMGVPMEKLVVATNSNDILARFWETGRYEKIPSSAGKSVSVGVQETPSPAMDILVSSNFERLLWYLAYETAGNDVTKAGKDIKTWMNSVKSDGRCEVPFGVLELARRDFSASRVSNEEVRIASLP